MKLKAFTCRYYSQRNSLSALSALEEDTRRTREKGHSLVLEFNDCHPALSANQPWWSLSIILLLKSIKIAINIATYSALAQCEYTIWHEMSLHNVPWERLSLSLSM